MLALIMELNAIFKDYLPIFNLVSYFTYPVSNFPSVANLIKIVACYPGSTDICFMI